MKRTTLGYAAAAFAAVLAAAPLAARSADWHHGGGGWALLHGLQLTDAQKAEIKTIVGGAHEAAKPEIRQLRDLHEQLTAKMLSAGTTEQDLAPILRQEEQLRGQLDQERVSTMLKIRSVLTPEQLQQAAETNKKLVSLHRAERRVTGEN